MKLVSQAILALAFVAAVAAAVVLLVRGSAAGGGIEIVLPAATSEAVVEMRVYLTGAVREPGVYVVGPESRLMDVIDAAGGAMADADLAAVNLAVRVRDEQHWHIPRQGDGARAPPAAGTTSSGKIDINSAGGEQLESLPEIGKTLAQRIMDHRNANGPFSSVDGLLEVRGIGPATLDAIRDLVEAR